MAKRMKEKTEKLMATKDKRPCAHARYIRISPSKVRIVLDTVRGKSVNDALAALAVTPKAASEIVYKLIQSATANAEHNNGLARADLYVAEIYADGDEGVVPKNRILRLRYENVEQGEIRLFVDGKKKKITEIIEDKAAVETAATVKDNSDYFTTAKKERDENRK